jgi:hypothetical protein
MNVITSRTIEMALPFVNMDFPGSGFSPGIRPGLTIRSNLGPVDYCRR